MKMFLHNHIIFTMEEQRFDPLSEMNCPTTDSLECESASSSPVMYFNIDTGRLVFANELEEISRPLSRDEVKSSEDEVEYPDPIPIDSNSYAVMMLNRRMNNVIDTRVRCNASERTKKIVSMCVSLVMIVISLVIYFMKFLPSDEDDEEGSNNWSFPLQIVNTSTEVVDFALNLTTDNYF